jgi:hypothetical protein
VEDCDSFPFLLAKEVAEEDTDLLLETDELIVVDTLLVPFKEPDPELLTDADLLTEPLAVIVPLLEEDWLESDESETFADVDALFEALEEDVIVLVGFTELEVFGL